MSLFQPSWVYKQAVLYPVHSVSPLLLPRQSPPLQVFTSPLSAAPGCGAPVLRRAHMILYHSEMFPLTGLLSRSAILPITWEGLSGCSIGEARCSGSAWGCSIQFKKAQVASPLEWALDNSPPVLQAGWQLPQVKRCLAAHPMRAEDIPLKRHSDTCRGISTYIATSCTMPTQEAFWYLPWDCYLYRYFVHYAYSRGILIFAVGLLPKSPVHSLRPLKRYSYICRGTTAGPFSSPLYAPLKRQHCRLRGHPLNFHSCSHC